MFPSHYSANDSLSDCIVSRVPRIINLHAKNLILNAEENAAGLGGGRRMLFVFAAEFNTATATRGAAKKQGTIEYQS